MILDQDLQLDPDSRAELRRAIQSTAQRPPSTSSPCRDAGAPGLSQQPQQQQAAAQADGGGTPRVVPHLVRQYSATDATVTVVARCVPTAAACSSNSGSKASPQASQQPRLASAASCPTPPPPGAPVRSPFTAAAAAAAAAAACVAQPRPALPPCKGQLEVKKDRRARAPGAPQV